MSTYYNPAIPQYFQEEWRREQLGRQLADPRYLDEYQRRERQRAERVRAQGGNPLPEFESSVPPSEGD